MQIKDVVIIVPVYKNCLNRFEQISLLQLNHILGAYPVCYLAPKRLDLSFYEPYGINRIVRFEDKFFSDTVAYSSLCLSNALYENFLEYEYILVYQLDAFVFSDKIIEFCKMGYDYIGAPVPRESWGDVPFCVGNGGFSLRKVDSFLRVLEKKEALMTDFRKQYGNYYGELLKGWEDCFYAYCGYRKDVDFSVPDMNTAFEFSIEYNINSVFETLNFRLPFGCHRWYDNRFDIWWPTISKQGYEIDDATYELYMNRFPWHEYRVFMNELDTMSCTEDIVKRIKEMVKSNDVTLWGYGIEGRKIKSFLKRIGIRIDKVFDRGELENEEVEYPYVDAIRKINTPLIVSTSSFEYQVSNELIEMGLKENRDFYLWSKIVQMLLPSTGIMEKGSNV